MRMYLSHKYKAQKIPLEQQKQNNEKSKLVFLNCDLNFWETLELSDKIQNLQSGIFIFAPGFSLRTHDMSSFAYVKTFTRWNKASPGFIF